MARESQQPERCQIIYHKAANLVSMCSNCGCGIDLGSTETVFARDYHCLQCGEIFKGFGWKPECLRCKSRDTKAVKR